MIETIMNGYIVEENIDGTFHIYEDLESEKAIKVAENTTEMIKWCNTH